MRLLVTNDDGIDSVFLHELVRALRQERHEVYVVAPKREQSWIGAAKSRHRAVHAECVHAQPEHPCQRHALGCPTWIVDGTPSDAVNIALAHLLPRPAEIEAVVSGINVGLNASLGFIIGSGTVSAAFEGALHGLPGIAFSQDIPVEAYDELKATGTPSSGLLATLQTSARHAARLVPQLAASTAPASFTVHNVNFPQNCHAGSTVRPTVPAQVVMPGLFSPAADDGTHRLVFRLGDDVSPAAPLTDRGALSAGYISHTVLDYRALGR